MLPGEPAQRAAEPIMSDEQKPRRDSGGHITIPPELRPFSAKEGANPVRVREKSPGAEAMFTKIAGELGDEANEVQVIDPERGVGNASAYVAPLKVPAPVVGKGVTSKVKIDAAKAKSDPPPAMAVIEVLDDVGAGEPAASPWAKAPVMAIDAGALPSALLPRPVEGGVVESKRPEPKERRYGLLALAIGAVVVGLGVVMVLKMGEVPDRPAGGAAPSMAAASGVGTAGAPPVAAESAMATAPPTATAMATGGAAGMEAPAASAVPSAGAVVPSAPSAPHPKPREDDPYDAAPPLGAAPVKTGAPSAPPSPTVTPNVPPASTKTLVEDRPVF